MAGAKKIFRVTGYTLDGSTIFMVEYRVEVDGRSYDYNSTYPADTPRDRQRRLNQFFMELLMPMMDRIDAGLAPPLPRMTANVDGVDYTFDRWTDTRPGWGEVVYWECLLPD